MRLLLALITLTVATAFTAPAFAGIMVKPRPIPRHQPLTTRLEMDCLASAHFAEALLFCGTELSKPPSKVRFGII